MISVEHSWSGKRTAWLFSWGERKIKQDKTQWIMSVKWWSVSFFNMLYNKTASALSKTLHVTPKVVQIWTDNCTAFEHPGYKQEFKCWFTEEKQTDRRVKGGLWAFCGLLWCPGPCSLTCFSLVFVASVLYLLPASSTHHCCFYVSARHLQSYGFKKCLEKMTVSRDRRVRLTQKKQWTHERETNTWKSCRQKKLNTKSDTDSYWLHTLYVHMLRLYASTTTGLCENSMNQTSYDSINEPLGAEDFDMRRFFFYGHRKILGGGLILRISWVNNKQKLKQ